jgi:hypothetical protein
MSILSLANKSKTTTRGTPTDEITDLGVAWVNLIFHGPLFGSIFAFAFVIGYFYSVNIAWFAFFSLPEHLVFALQGLPVALGGSIILLILLSLSHHSSGWGIPSERKTLWLKRIGLTWMIVLSIAFVYFAFNKGVAGPFCFLALIGGVYCFTFIHSPEDKFVHVMYWGINVATLCLLVGFITGEIHKDVPIGLTVTTKNENACMDNDKSAPCTGKVIFYGSSGVLFSEKRTGELSFIKQGSIAKISDTRR